MRQSSTRIGFARFRSQFNGLRIIPHCEFWSVSAEVGPSTFKVDLRIGLAVQGSAEVFRRFGVFRDPEPRLATTLEELVRCLAAARDILVVNSVGFFETLE